LIGFPGLNLTGCTIKLAQQNFREHFKVLSAIADKFNPDAIFPLMDLSVEANALGRYTIFPKEDYATVPKDEFNLSDIEKWINIDISSDSRVHAYTETIRLINNEMTPLILRGAYVTGPYTLAGLIMGADEAALATIMQTENLHKVLSLTLSKILEFVSLIINSGAQIICILEPSAVMLGPEQFKLFSASYVKQITACCKSSNVATVYHICGNTMHLIEKMAGSGVDALSLDSAESGVRLPEVSEKISEDVIIIGNICPTGTLLMGKPEKVKQEVLELLISMGAYPNFILSTGCDLPQETPIENILAFMDAGRNYRMN